MAALDQMADQVILITGAGMGRGDPQLQERLLRTYLRLLLENDLLPAAICFYTDGVKLVVSGSPVIEEIRQLEAKGVRMVVCNTCLRYFDLGDQVEVGIVGGMTDIIEAQRRAAKVITL